MDIQKFYLGDKVRDTVSGVSGVITGIYYSLTGCIRYALQPKKEKGEKGAPESVWLLEGLLVSKLKNPIEVLPFEFGLGDLVKDIVTKKLLVIISKEVHYAGYNRYRCRLLKSSTLEEVNTLIGYEEAEICLSKSNFLKTVEKDIKVVQERVEEKVPSPVADNRMSSK